jgi:RHH-type proline utilization regulon transcriptional repressor/proline dehydrogenase/delta 1-pyrroline-5-carboxylate dehydrogenase
MDELVVGDPAMLSTDVGPAIDRAAQEMLEAHARRLYATVTDRVRVAAAMTAGGHLDRTSARQMRPMS